MGARGPKARSEFDELTRQELEFVDAYLANPKDENASAAAAKVGFKNGVGLLKKPCIANEITRRRRLAAKRAEITEDFVLAGVRAIAMFDPRALYDDDGEPIPITQLDEDTAKAIAGLDVESLYDYEEGKKTKIGVVRKYRLADRLKAYELLGKYVGAWDGTKSVNRKNGLEQLRDAILNSPK